MSELATNLCSALPAEPISVADVLAIKREAYPDIDPMFGLKPAPRENVIVCHVTDGTTMSYIGVEASGWTVLVEFSITEYPDIEAAIAANMPSVVEWAETYYSDRTFAMFDRRRQ